MWSIVLVDKFYTTRAFKSYLFSTVGNIRGDLPILALSVTPFTRTTNVATISITAFTKYFNGMAKNFAPFNLTNVPNNLKYKASDFSTSTYTYMVKGLNKEQIEVINRLSY